MKKLKSITTFITTALMLFSLTALSQTKEETVKYINDLYQKAFQYSDNSGTIFKVDSVILDGKTLVIKIGTGNGTRRELMPYKNLEVEKGRCGTGDYISDAYNIISSDNSTVKILWCIGIESDAKRLKNALEHLIKLVEDEPETDPFAY